MGLAVRRGLVLLAVLASAGAAPAARAEGQPAILKAYGLDWIERVKEEAWPQPKSQRPVICLLDTGVAITPDTPADNPEGPIVARLSVEPGPTGFEAPDADAGLPQGTSFLHFHGTRMAAIIGAPRNGAGTVGIFPGAQILSVRVTYGSDVYVAPDQLVVGVRLCKRWAVASGRAIAAVVMAESGVEERVQDVAKWETAAALAREAGGIFIAAAGNSPNSRLVAPLAASDVLAVGAGDDNGGLCKFAQPEGNGDLLGPGCSDQDPAWYPGSSSAAAAIGALAGALAARSPQESPGSRYASLLQAAAPSSRLQGAVLQNRFGGLIRLPEVVEETLPQTTVTRETDVRESDQAQPRILLWRPGIILRSARKRLLYERTARSKIGFIKLRISDDKAPITLKGRSGAVRLQRVPRTVTVWAESKDGRAWRSLTSRAKVRR